jgi:hypothetical protein
MVGAEAALSIDDLLSRGGWELDDVQARHAEHPDTFSLPPREELDALRRGCLARLIFRLVDQADPVRDEMAPYDGEGRPQLITWCERMLVWVQERDGDDFVGILKHFPVSSHTALIAGSRVRFQARDVIEVDCRPEEPMDSELAILRDVGFPVLELEESLRPVDPARRREVDDEQERVCAAAGVLPELPFVLSGALATPSVFKPDRWPLYGGRFAPKPEQNHCGWMLYRRVADSGDIPRRDRLRVTPFADFDETRAWPYLALPPGWAFVLDADGHEDVYFDSDLLSGDAR